MSKRKRNRKPAEHQPSPSSANAQRAPSQGTEQGRGRKNQNGLLAIALILLSIAVYWNVRNFHTSHGVSAIPFPSVEISDTPLAAVQPASGTRRSGSGTTSDTPRFTLLSPDDTGVKFTHPVLPDHPQSYLYFSSMAAGGMAVGDVSGDGRPDLYIVSGPLSNRLFVQGERDFQFDDVTEMAGVGGGEVWGCGATMVDINADGRLDIFVANYDAPNQLFINLGNGRFEDRALAYGLNITDASLEGVFADYDRDGDLDLYLVTYRYENPSGMPAKAPLNYAGGKPAIRSDMEKYYEVVDDTIGYGVVGRSDGLLRNNGDGTFSNYTYQAGIYGHGHGQSATWFDYNDDGYPDLFVGNDFNDPDRLYRNNRDGTMTDVIHQALPHTTWFSMGSDAADVNGDGRIDLFSADMSSTTHFKQKTTMGSMGRNRAFLETAVPRQYMRNALQLNTGTPRFQESAYLAGLDSTDWTWAVKLNDFDCDGRPDVFVTNGSVRTFTDSDRTLTLAERVGKTEWDIYRDSQPLREQNLAFRNEGDLQFSDVSQSWGLAHVGVSMAAAHADFDRDGDLDLVVANVDEPLSIYRNETAEHQRITVRLQGRGQNRFGVGARVTLTSDAGSQVQELHPSRGFLASNDPTFHFGCGEATQVSLAVSWPSGAMQSFPRLPTGRHYEIAEPSSTASAQTTTLPPSNTTQPPLFQQAELRGLMHQENQFDDYALQPLLPHRLSQLGPGLAMADVDGDGDQDLYLGGAMGSPGSVVLQGDGGLFSLTNQPDLMADQQAEDAGAIWIDVDGDADVDLIVAGGGNERPGSQGANSKLAAVASTVISAAAHGEDDDPYALRLYRNDGTGRLTRDRGNTLPPLRTSASSLSAADFDRDGDVDLFVAGRQQPGQYPLPGSSYLLRRDGDRFVDATGELAPGLGGVGMVTSSLWSDVDGDADLDLLVATEWGRIHLFRNDQGRLRDDSAAAGLNVYTGWWTSIVAGDFDADGDIDYVVGNMGLNTKYHATVEHPFQIFYGDFEGTGDRQLVEAEYENQTLFPVRGKSCSTHAMPMLANKFTTYKDFAAASLQDIYTERCLSESYQVSANTLASMLLVNDGHGHLEFRPLPRIAQISPAFGMVVSEFNGDGYPDLFLAQNFFSPQPETGNFDGGIGCLLLGTGEGRFDPVDPQHTGFVLAGDCTAAVATDLNHDNRPDLLVATNNGPVQVLRHMGTGTDREAGEFLRVRWNRADVTSLAGTVVTVDRVGRRQIREISAGSGYLSQQPGELFFGSPKGVGDWHITVRAPSGTVAEYFVPPGDNELVIP